MTQMDKIEREEILEFWFTDESEPDRLAVVYDFTKNWRIEWGGYDLYTSPGKEPLICNRDYGSLMIVKLEKGDLSCTRYVSLK